MGAIVEEDEAAWAEGEEAETEAEELMKHTQPPCGVSKVSQEALISLEPEIQMNNLGGSCLGLLGAEAEEEEGEEEGSSSSDSSCGGEEVEVEEEEVVVEAASWRDKNEDTASSSGGSSTSKCNFTFARTYSKGVGITLWMYSGTGG